MDFEKALKTELNTLTGVTNKVFPIKATQGTEAPYVVYKSNLGLEDKTLGGYLESKDISVDIIVVTKTFANSKTLTEQVITLIKSFQSRRLASTGPIVHNVTYEEPVLLEEVELGLPSFIINVKISI